MALIEVSVLGLATAAVAGVISFASSCVLPLLPGYLSYVAGGVEARERAPFAPPGSGRVFRPRLHHPLRAARPEVQALDGVLQRYSVEANLIGGGLVMVFRLAMTVQGILVLIPQSGAMLLDNVAVAPEAQGSGFGRLMLKFAERESVKAGCHAITLYANEGMTENIALYSRIGYAETHRVEEKGLRRVYMRKLLGEPRSGMAV